MVESTDKPNFYDQIQWPINPPLRDQELWKQNMGLVRILCDIADAVEWLEPGDTYIHMPKKYSVKGMKIEFIPNWGFVKIGGVDFDPSISADNVLEAIEHIKKLKELGALRLNTS